MSVPAPSLPAPGAKEPGCEPCCAEREGVGNHALAAAAAGTTGAVLSTVLFYPVELVKNRLQATVRGDGGFAYTGLLDGLTSVVREEGMSGLFTGIRPVVLRVIAGDFATIWFGELLVGFCKFSALDLPLRVLGGWCSVSLTLPLETISTRVTVSRPPLSSTAAVRALWREGGLFAFWRGLGVMLVLCINPALTYSSFEWIRSLWISMRTALRSTSASTDQEERSLSASEAFVVGAAAKLFTLCVVYPLIRAKFLLQAGSASAGKGLFQVLREVASKEGYSSLYRGLDAQLSKSLLSTALLLAVKERTQEQWRRVLLRPAITQARPPS